MFSLIEQTNAKNSIPIQETHHHERIVSLCGLVARIFDGGVFSTFCGSPERYAGDAERDRYPDAKIA